MRGAGQQNLRGGKVWGGRRCEKRGRNTNDVEGVPRVLFGASPIPRLEPSCGATGQAPWQRLGCREQKRKTPRLHEASACRGVFLGPQVGPFASFFGWEGSPTKIDYRNRLQKKGHPYSNLSTGGPRFPAKSGLFPHQTHPTPYY